MGTSGGSGLQWTAYTTVFQIIAHLLAMIWKSVVLVVYALHRWLSTGVKGTIMCGEGHWSWQDWGQPLQVWGRVGGEGKRLKDAWEEQEGGQRHSSHFVTCTL